MTRVLMISTDRKILDEGSPVRARMIEYGKLFESLDIVLFFVKGQNSFDKTSLAPNVIVHPTNSTSKFGCVGDAFAECRKLLERNGKADTVITCQDPFETGLVGLVLSKTYRVPLHVQIHTDFKSPYFARELSFNSIRIACLPFILRQAKAIRTVSDRIQNSLNLAQKAKSSVLPIYADMEEIKSAPISVNLKTKYPGFEKICLMASRLTKEKDFESAIDAFAIVQKKLPNIALVIVGEGPCEQSIRRKIAHYGISKNIFIEGWADRRTLISYMKTCDMFVSTSLYEGYGLSMLEAHASGAYVVATDAGIAPLIVSPDALVPPGDVLALSNALIKAMQGPNTTKAYIYPYSSKIAYLEAFKADIERALL